MEKYNFFDIFKIFLLFSMLYIILTFHYLNIISEYFSYEGFVENISLIKISLSLIFLFYLSLTFWKLPLEKPSTHLLNIMIFVSIIPMLVLYSLQNLSSFFIIYIIVSLTIIRFILNIKAGKIIKLLNLKILEIIVIFLSIILILWLFIINWKYFNLDILKVYDYRAIISEKTPEILSYLYNITFKGLIPLLFLYYLFYNKSFFRKMLISIFTLFAYIIIFGLTSHKFFLFIIPTVIFIYLYFSKIKNVSLNLMILLLVFLISLLVMVNIHKIIFILESLFVRRVIFVPALLNFNYYDFFSENPFVFFTDSKFSPMYYIIDYPYDVDISHLIGREIYGKPDMAANTGWIGSGYAHAGFIGMFIYAIIIGVLFKYLDFLSKYLNYKFIILSFIPYVVILFLSSDLKTVFITHGLIFYIILLNIFATNNKNKKDTKFEVNTNENLPHNYRSSII